MIVRLLCCALDIDKCRFVFAAVVGLLMAAPVAAQSIRWEPYELAMANGAKAAAEIGRLTVPQRHDAPTVGTPIELAFVRLRTAARQPQPPLVYLDGGPGGAGYTAASIEEYTDLFTRAQATRDVILLSQRGTGLSRPRLICPAESPLPEDFFASADTMLRELGPRAARCAAALQTKGIDLTAFTTAATAHDLDALRRALGVDRLALFGFSYGTHVALATLKLFPQAVDRVVLAGTEGPMHTWKLPQTMEEQFGKLAAAAGGDLENVWRRLLARAEQQPLRIPLAGGDGRSILLGAAGLQYVLRRDIGDTNDWPILPSLIREAERGDLDSLARLASRRFRGFNGGVDLLPVAMDCASGASTDRLAAIQRQQPSPIIGVMTNFPYPQACEQLKLPMLPESFRAPVQSDVPALFISGTLDSNTPPAQADAVAAGFTRAAHLVVEHAGHESTLAPDAVRDAIVAFLQGERIDSRRIPGKPLSFRHP